MKIKAWQIQILGILALALLFILTIPLFASRIPSVLQTYLSQDLSEQGYDWVRVDIKGRNVVLTGSAPTTKKSFAAFKVIEKYTPVLRINDQITPRIIQPYSMSMNWNGKLLKLNGYVPNQASYTQFIEAVAQHVAQKNFQGKLELGVGAPENWQKIIETSMKGLLKLQQGRIEIINQSLYFAGQTPYSAKRDEIIQSFDEYKQYQKKLHIVAGDENSRICQKKFKILLENSNVKFSSGGSIIDKSSYLLLAQLANIAALCSRSKISIEGHTDNKGHADANMKLSQDRAEMVANWLFQQGISEKRLIAVGHGALKPIADNQTEEGRAHNRRIEFVIKGE
jgi:OOP family OmpA-OmpF porin